MKTPKNNGLSLSDSLSVFTTEQVNEFEELITEHESTAYYLAELITGSSRNAEEILAHTFAEGYEGLVSGMLAADSFATWIYSKTVENSLKQLQDATRTVSLLAIDRILANCSQATGSKLSPESLSKLPPDYKRVLLLHDVAGLNCNNIAIELGLDPSHVRLILNRARLMVVRHANISSSFSANVASQSETNTDPQSRAGQLPV